MQHIEKCTYVYVVHVFEVDYLCRPQIPQQRGLFTWRWRTPGRCPYNFLFYFYHFYMIGGVTRLGGLPGLPGRLTLSAGVTIYHVNVSRWGNPPGRGRVHGKKRKMYVLKLCAFPSRLVAEITRNCNGNTRSVKCSHFGIFSTVNRSYLISQTIPYNVLSQRFLAKPNTT